jgi:signal transduction histidine kinase
VKRALESVAAERAARERAVAERVFDELERALSELLWAEEARPASDYDFASVASPLHEKPVGALARGWFQLEADGRVSAPIWAERAAALGAEIAQEGGRLESAPSESRARAIGSGAPLQIRQKRELAFPEPVVPAKEPAAPAASAVGSAGAPPPPEPRAADEIAPSAPRHVAKDESADAYSALAKLNTGAKEREERKQRVYVEKQAQASAPAAEPPTSAPEERPDAIASSANPDADLARERSAGLVARAMAAPPRQEWSEPAPERAAAADSAEAAAGARRDAAAVGRAEELASERDSADSRAAQTPEETPPEPVAGKAERVAEAPPPSAASRPQKKSALGRPAPDAEPARARLGAMRAEPQPDGELVRVVVDPMRGRLARSGELLLLRSAWIGPRGVRQGVVFEPAALERLLVEKVIPQGALSEARLRLAPSSELAVPPESSERRAFAHRFGEPFDALGADLSFAPFADAGARSVYWLAALFSLAGACGLYAAYRTTAVALHFAERRSNFAAAVSHELKTPLTAIRLYAEMLRDGLVASDDKRREYYGSITAETERLSRLIDNVLEFSRLEKGTRSLELRVGDAAPVVREAVELLRPHAAAHGLALELAVDEALPPVRFERDALLQVVFNLIDNSVKYGRGEPAAIEIACRRAGEGVAIVVRDHGPGVPREELTRILEPFYRRGDELTRSAPGAGIGLALVQSLAREMGGPLRVANADGGGLEVTLELSGDSLTRAS